MIQFSNCAVAIIKEPFTQKWTLYVIYNDNGTSRTEGKPIPDDIIEQIIVDRTKVKKQNAV